MGRPFFPRAIPIYGVLPYSMIIPGIHLECKELHGSEVHKDWKVHPGWDRGDYIIFRETAGPQLPDAHYVVED